MPHHRSSSVESMQNVPDQQMRGEAASIANRDDAELWRWFCLMFEERRIRWCESGRGWLVSVDHKHLATEPDFDAAVRNAHNRYKLARQRPQDGQ